MEHSEFFGHLYSKKDFSSQQRFVGGLFSAGGSAYFSSSPISSNSYEKKIYQGRPITESIRESFPTPINIDGIIDFFYKNLDPARLPLYLNKFGISAEIEEDFDFFCIAIAKQFALFIESATNDAENIVLKEYQKLIEDPSRAISITKTLTKSINFDSIFTAVPHKEKLSTVNESKLNLYHLNPVNGLFQFDALESFLVKNISSYIHDRVTISGYESNEDIATMVAKAIGAFQKAKDIDESWLDNELGNILIYAFLEQVLEAPKIYTKIELLASGHEQTALSGGSVHLLNTGSDSAPAYQLVFGKSNINNDITAAIDMAIDAVKGVVSGINNELRLISNPILSTNFPDSTAKLLANILVPTKSKDKQVPNAFGIFLGYSLNLSGVPNDAFRAAVAAKMQADISCQSKYLADKITAEGLDGYSFYFYFLPFNNAEIEKKTVMKNILQGGR